MKHKEEGRQNEDSPQSGPCKQPQGEDPLAVCYLSSNFYRVGMSKASGNPRPVNISFRSGSDERWRDRSLAHL